MLAHIAQCIPCKDGLLEHFFSFRFHFLCWKALVCASVVVALSLPCLADSTDKSKGKTAGQNTNSAGDQHTKLPLMEPFSIVYKITQSNGGTYKQYVWADGQGAFRMENELPYTVVDGITDVSFEDYKTRNRYIVNTMFETVEVSKLENFSMPLTSAEFTSELKAKPIGEKKIAGFQCKGWTYQNAGATHEVWVSPELKWFLEHRTIAQGITVVCTAQKALHQKPDIEKFTLPGKYKYVDVSENKNSHSHQHSH